MMQDPEKDSGEDDGEPAAIVYAVAAERNAALP